MMENIEIHTDYIKLDAFLKFCGEAALAYGLQKAQRAHARGRGRVFRHLEGNRHMGLRREVVNFIRRYARH